MNLNLPIYIFVRNLHSTLYLNFQFISTITKSNKLCKTVTVTKMKSVMEKIKNIKNGERKGKTRGSSVNNFSNSPLGIADGPKDTVFTFHYSFLFSH